MIISVALPNRYLVAVSNTATIVPGTVWSYFQWTNTRTEDGVGGGASCLGDYPTLGVDEDALYIGVNQFCGANINNLTFDSTSIYRGAQERAALRRAAGGRVRRRGGERRQWAVHAQGVDNFDSGTDQGYVIGVDNLAFGQLTLRRVSDPAGARVCRPTSRSPCRRRPGRYRCPIPAAPCRSTPSTTGCYRP